MLERITGIVAKLGVVEQNLWKVGGEVLHTIRKPLTNNDKEMCILGRQGGSWQCVALEDVVRFG